MSCFKSAAEVWKGLKGLQRLSIRTTYRHFSSAIKNRQRKSLKKHCNHTREPISMAYIIAAHWARKPWVYEGKLRSGDGAVVVRYSNDDYECSKFRTNSRLYGHSRGTALAAPATWIIWLVHMSMLGPDAAKLRSVHAKFTLWNLWNWPGSEDPLLSPASFLAFAASWTVPFKEWKWFIK